MRWDRARKWVCRVMPDDRLTSAERIDWPCLRATYAGFGLREQVSLGDLARRCRGVLGYLATPYSRPVLDEFGAWCPLRSDDLGREAARWSRLLACEGISAISPVLIAVEMISADRVEGALDPLDHMFWTTWCRPLLNRAQAVIVPPVAGWQDSLGVWQEARAALSCGTPVFLVAEGAA